MKPLRGRRLPAAAEWAYVVTTIGAFVFAPELRRLVDWRGSFDPLNTFAVIPLVMLCPLAVLAARRWGSIRSTAFRWVCLTWLAGFGYATFVAVPYGDAPSALFVGARFCLPLTLAVWFVTRNGTLSDVHGRLAGVLFAFGSIAGFYGIVQYFVAPPWDTAWIQNIDVPGDFGTPERFGIRVFTVLNDPVTSSLFLGAVILFNLPYVDLRRWPHMLALLAMLVSLMLSFFRTAWIAVAIGIAVFVLLSPTRARALGAVGSLVGLCVAATLVLLVTFADSGAGDKIRDRFQTLSDIGGDYSFNERQANAEDVLQKSLDAPLGAGLGITGSGAKLGSADSRIFRNVPSGPAGSIDNGFLSRLFEMGVPGFIAILFASLGAIGLALRNYFALSRALHTQGMVVAASCIATQVALFTAMLSEDDLQGLTGLLFFTAFAVGMLPAPAGEAMTPGPAPSWRPPRPDLFSAVR